MRPINMRKIITALPEELSFSVIPMERPVVPKAEQTSKRISFNRKGSIA